MNDNAQHVAPAGIIPPAMPPTLSDSAHVAPGAPSAAAAPVEVCIMGVDARGKKHASVFSAADAGLAERAAALMGMRVLPLATDEHRALAAPLARGKIFASGLGFVPYCSEKLFSQLKALPGAFSPARPAEAGLPPRGSGKLVGGRGVRQAVDPADKASAPASDPADAPANAPAKPARLAIGSVVLARETDEQEGWWEAVVAAEKGDDLLILRWRDWPDLPVVIRHRDHVALLPPGLIGKQVENKP